MVGLHSVLDRAVPDVTSTADLDIVSAAEVDLTGGRAERWTVPEVEAGLRARALVLSGRPHAARRALDGIDPGRVAVGPTRGVPTPTGEGSASLQGMASAVWAASRVGAAPELVGALREGLGRTVGAGGASRDTPASGGMLHDRGVVLGPAATVDALLVAVEGSIDRAIRHARAAVGVADARGPFWGASARLELARLLGGALDVAGPEDPGRADLTAQRDATLGAAMLFFRSTGHAHMATRCAELTGPPRPEPLAAPGLGHLLRGGRPGGDGDPDQWLVGVGVQPPVQVRHGRGLDALAHLLAHRERAVPAVELAAVLDRSDAWDVIVATAGEDPDALARLVRDDAARTRVSKLVQRTVRSLGEQHPALGAHLGARVRTGFVCSYRDEVTVWRL